MSAMSYPGGLEPHSWPVCESCGVDADLRLEDGSHWCIGCDTVARRNGYDNSSARLLPTRGGQQS